MSVSALSTNNLASPSISGVGAARPLYYKNLSNAGIAELTASQIGEMRSVEMAALSDSQIKAFNPAALASGLPTYLNNKQVLPTTFILSLGNNQISQFGAPLVNATLSKMSVTQIGAIHTSAISGIGAAALQSLSGAQLSGFTQAQVAQASTTQIASLKPQQISALSPGWLNVLSSSQLQSLGSASIAALTKTQIAGLDAAHVKDLSAAQVASLSKAQLGALNGSQIAAIDATDIKAMTTSQFGALTKTQLQALTVGQIGQVDAFKIRTISAKNFASLYTNQVAAFTTKAVANLGGNQLAAMTKEQISQGLDPAKIGALSASRMRYFNPSQISALTNPEVAAISLSAMKTLYDPHLRAFTVDQLSNLSEDKIDWLINKKLQITGFTALQKDAILGRKASFSNAAPTVAHAITDKSATEDVAFTFTVPSNTFADVDSGDTLSYAATRADGSALPSWLSFNANTRTFSGTPGNADPGELNLKVTATDRVGASISSAFKLTVVNVNDAPTVANLITDQNATEGVAFTFTVPSNTFADVDSGDTLSYTATRADDSALPSWLQFNANTRTFSGTPGYADPGELNLKVTASDLAGATVSSAFKVTVVASNAVLTKQWTKLLGTSVNDNANALTTGLDGSIYVCGYTGGALDGQTSRGDLDAFVTKYSADGTKAWTKLLGSSYDDRATALTTGLDGSIYVAGQTIGVLDGQTSSNGDAFITKYSADGTKAWTKLLGSSGNEEAHALTTGLDGSIYVSGQTSGAFDGQTDSGGTDAFLTKYSADGTKAWTKLLGTASSDYAQALTAGLDGSIYVAGHTDGALDGQTNSGDGDAFLTKYSADGTKAWTKLLGSSGTDTANALTTGLDGSIYVSGYTNGALDEQTNSGMVDAFLTKFNPNGTKEWTQLLGTSGEDLATALTTGVDGSVYVGGYTYGSLDGQASSGYWDAFITKFNPDGEKEWTKLLGSSSSDQTYALTTGADGAVYMSGRTFGNLDGQLNSGNWDVFITKYSV